ncbi:uncharacterized protein [Venturia canescens]|uniref:uncharacterized protein n=1 Tax=Venturia canescens TaxID=32260 RepID=UPI001C9CC8A0|nr:uncharacterized protein LOC122406016 [Venturia canescens]
MLKISGFMLMVLLQYLCAGWDLVNSSEIREDISVVRICNVSDPVDLDVFNDYMMHHDFQHLKNHAGELSCFLLCIYNQYKWMNRQGSFKISKIKSWMNKSNLSLIDQEILLHKCIRMAELSDPCTRARRFTECFWSNHQGAADPSEGSKHTLDAIIGKKDVM